MTARSHGGLILFAALVVALTGCTTAGAGTATSAPIETQNAMPEEEGSAAGTGVALAAEQYTPVTMGLYADPTWITNSEGIVQVSYELRLTNNFPFPATATEVVVTDVATGEPILTLTGDDLLATMSLQPSGAVPDVELQPSVTGVVWIDLAFDEPAQIPAEIEHTVSVRMPDDLPIVLPDPITWTAARVTIDPTPPIVIGPPLEGPGWVAVGSCCDGPHRRAMNPVDNQVWLAQRYAIDFNKLSDDDQFATGDPDLNESWPTWDQPVLAVADSTVVQAADEFADQIPNNMETVPLEGADGNYVILEIDEGVYAFYAHLKPGSVAVQPGDTVAKGEVIGRTGNSGNSTGPHLHFQVMDRPSALVASSVAYVIDTFTVTGRTPPIDEVITADPQQPTEIDTAGAGPRTDQLPVGRDVLQFVAVD